MNINFAWQCNRDTLEKYIIMYFFYREISIRDISWSRLREKTHVCTTDDVYFIRTRGKRQRHWEIILRDNRKKFRVTAVYIAEWIELEIRNRFAAFRVTISLAKIASYYMIARCSIIIS